MIHCVAIDDEPIALSIIKEHCDQYGDIQLDCFSSPEEGLRFIRTIKPDIVFLDIEMNSVNGLEIAKQIPDGTLLIFTTAYSEYALDGFNLNAVDFLHKPIFYPRFEQAMKKVERLRTSNSHFRQDNETITLKSEYRRVVVNLDDILYLEAMDNYVKVYRKDLPTIITQITMKEIENVLPSSKFVRVHRSFIVPLAGIEEFSTRKITLRDVEEPITVGRTYADTFLKFYKAFRRLTE